MSRADELYRQTCIDILENGFYDTDLEVRPRWADGTPAHTVKKFGVVNRYNLKEEYLIEVTLWLLKIFTRDTEKD